MPTPASFLRTLRQVHLYVGVFIAPALLFFAFTGFLQTAGFQDMNTSPRWVKVLAQVHKKQTYILPQRKPKAAAVKSDGDAAPAGTGKRHRDEGDAPKPAPAGDASMAAPAPPPAPATPPPSHLPEKLFFFLVCFGLFTSTLTGLYMSYKYNSNKTAVTTLLILGIVLPLLFLKF